MGEPQPGRWAGWKMAWSAKSPSSRYQREQSKSGVIFPILQVLRGTWKQDCLLGVCGGSPRDLEYQRGCQAMWKLSWPEMNCGLGRGQERGEHLPVRPWNKGIINISTPAWCTKPRLIPAQFKSINVLFKLLWCRLAQPAAEKMLRTEMIRRAENRNDQESSHHSIFKKTL